MPACSKLSESKSSAEAMDTTKQFLQMVDKKVRNLEKRKVKLDQIRDKQQAGETLEKEQKDAIKHYDEVKLSLESIRDLQKQFTSLANDLEKQAKKQAKREKQERASSEQKRIVDLLRIQSTLDALGTETVRDHFKSGKYGAVVLTEDNLKWFDELYQLVTPTRDGDGVYNDKVNTAAEHFQSLLESRERPVVGTTYKELMELIMLILNCGYFERAKEAEAEAAVTAETAEPATEEVAEEEEVQDEEEQTPEDFQNNATEEAAPLAEPASTEEYFQSAPVSAAPVYQPISQAQVQAAQQARIRPLPEIMSSVRGNFSFLQDSEIEMDSPHMDPAVVVAQPMMRPSSVNAQPPHAMTGGFPAPPMVDQEDTDPLSLSQQSLEYSNASQSFAQSLNQSSGMVPEVLFQAPPPPTPVEDSAQAPSQPPSQQLQPSQPQASQVPHLISQGQPPTTTFSIPPSIPMPPSQSQVSKPGQRQQTERRLREVNGVLSERPQHKGVFREIDGVLLLSDASEEGKDTAQMNQEKKFQLNASATEFQSMYTPIPPTMQPPPTQAPQVPQAHPPHPQIKPQETRPMGPPPVTVPSDFPPAPNFAQAAGDFSQAAGNFQGGAFQRGGRGGTGGFRGGQRGVRGGAPPNPNVQNGFNGRVQNGNSRPAGNRGGQSFQGFPPRTDYRPEGYQGFNNSNGFSGAGNGGPYQKRGGSAGGFSRGGTRGGAGAMRGTPRGGGGPPRGMPAGTRGGLTRPVNQ